MDDINLKPGAIRVCNKITAAFWLKIIRVIDVWVSMRGPGGSMGGPLGFPNFYQDPKMS